MHALMSHWQPVKAPHHPEKNEPLLSTEVTWSFDDPAHTAMAIRLYEDFAAKFNARSDDGSRLFCYGQFLAATLRWTRPAPRIDEEFTFTAMKNMRAVLRDQCPELADLVASAVTKHARIGTAARVESHHEIYKCPRTTRVAHAHRVRF